MLYVLCGNEPYLKRSFEERFKEISLEHGQEALKASDLDEAMDFVRNASFFTDKPCALVFADKKTLNSSDILEFLSSGEMVGDLLIKNDDLSEKDKIVSKFKEGGAKVTFLNKLKGQAFYTKLDEMIQNLEVSFGGNAKKVFVERVNYDNEDVTLSTVEDYLVDLKYQGKEVTEKLVKSIVPDNREGNVFLLGSLIANKDIAVYTELDRLLRNKESGMQILGALFREYRIAYKFKSGFSFQEIGLWKEPVLKNLDKSCLVKGMETIREALDSVFSGLLSEEDSVRHCISALML